MSFQVAIGQIIPHKADVEGNLNRICDLVVSMTNGDTPPDLVVFPETASSGYFLQGGVREVAMTSSELFSALSSRMSSRQLKRQVDVALGFYELWEGNIYNSAAYLTFDPSEPTNSKLVHTHRKFFLPTYGVFDEARFVARGRSINCFDTRLGRMSILVCEDAWHSITPMLAALQGTDILLVLSASPGRGFQNERPSNVEKWQRLLQAIAEEHGVWVLNSSLVGFEGGKGFVGSSMIIGPFGNLVGQAPLLAECVLTGTIDPEDIPVARANSPYLADLRAAMPDIYNQIEDILANLRRNS